MVHRFPTKSLFYGGVSGWSNYFFPVGNGDMTLVTLESGRTILVDINIRDPGVGIRDVGKDLRTRLKVDSNKRPYVDAMLLGHPDQDHCRGIIRDFHLGPLTDYKAPKDGEPAKIVIREMWSSPMVFRRASKNHVLCDDALAWAKEARRRVALFEKNGQFASGDRIQILGEDQGGKTDKLGAILVKAGQNITRIDGNADGTFRGLLLAPKGKGTDQEEETRSKNHSSVIIRLSVAHQGNLNACRFLTGGDAEVSIWERIWADHSGNTAAIDYHLLQTPHHCSWHSLSYDSWSDLGEKAKVAPAARKALGQALKGAFIVATSKPIRDDKNDPPCIRAKREFESILAPVGGKFVNTSIHGSESNPLPMEFEVTANGPSLRPAKADTPKSDSLLRPATAAAVPSGLGFPPRPVTPTKPSGFA
jgi:hypothetical protein